MTFEEVNREFRDAYHTKDREKIEELLTKEFNYKRVDNLCDTCRYTFECWLSYESSVNYKSGFTTSCNFYVKDKEYIF